MRSTHVDRFNHDDDAADYDRDVRDESHPIRAGYDAALTWVAERVPPDAAVVDLGCGTGNLSARISRPQRLICVDVATEMTAIARGKLEGIACTFIHADLLECLDQLPVVDAFASTYAVHHLTASEKEHLFRGIHRQLLPGGIAAFGDLMFESSAAREAILADYESTGRSALAASIRNEFFWNIDEALASLRGLGFDTEHRRFSELSWGISARR